MKTKDIIMVLDNAAKLRDEVQDQLREYVCDKDIPLEERFRVWAEYCAKKHYSLLTSREFVRALMRRKIAPPERRHQFIWNDFVIKPLDEMKEMLIEENFGSVENP